MSQHVVTIAGLEAQGVTARAASGVEVDVDLTVLGTIALFLVLFVVLKPLLFDPMLKLFEEREKRTLGAKKEAREMDQKSAGAQSKYEAEMQKARAAANAERDKLRAEGQKTENEILSKVRASTAQSLEEGRKRAGAELASARAKLKTDAAVLAKDLAARVLGREVSG
jgi:F-type H+-transporting ATPase subunit b